MTWVFGNDSRPQQRRAAALLRQIAGLVVSLEDDDPELDRLVIDLERAAGELAGAVPTDVMPRVGPSADGDGRLYLDHSRDIGDFNPCFPSYDLAVDGDRAAGTVEFPVVYEGPPGVVHGGFLALFFDCVMQHHNCDVGAAGKTASLALRYRRPAPIVTPLTFAIERSVTDGRITNTGRIELDGRVLCEAEMSAAAGDRANLPAVSPRRQQRGA